MILTGLHLLLTYQCIYECDHCFAWGSPQQKGTMTIQDISNIINQGKELGTVTDIYFEGGEPFLYYPIMLAGIRMANSLGFNAGIVSNNYWATTEQDAIEWLRPLADLVQNMALSNDTYHNDEITDQYPHNACLAAEKLGMSTGFIEVAEVEKVDAAAVRGVLPEDESKVMFRGRAAEKLAASAPHQPWSAFTECPHEDLREPERVHVDALGNLHACQGLVIGNLFQTPLAEICATYDPDAHPIVGPLLEGGPVGLVQRYGLSHEETYADACHLCYESRRALRSQFPEILRPDQMYGVF
jgi:sulfatase maturation enzyme AslB (radical SAM superfamily)